MSRRNGLLILKCAVSIALFVVLLWWSDIRKVWGHLRGVSWVGFGSANGLFFLATWATSVRLGCFLPSSRLSRLLGILYIARFYAQILPGQVVGEAFKVLLLRKEEPDLGRLVAVVVVDKWVGLCALLGLGCFGLLWSRPPVPLGIYALILLGGVGIFLLLWPLRMSFVLRWLKVGVLWLSERVGRESLGRKLLVLFETWQKEVQNTRLLGKALFWGAVYHGLAGAFFFVLALSCGVHVAFLDWLWIFSLLSLVLFLPISLGGLGLREGTLVGVLHWLGIPSPLAMSFAFALLGITLFHALLGGVWAQKVAWEERLAAKES